MAFRSRRVMAVAVVTAVPSLVGGHSFLSEPPSRNVVAFIAKTEFCAHCLQAGGPNTVKGRGNGVWPTQYAPESHGLCGDPVQGSAVKDDWRDEPYMQPTEIQATYRPGEIVEFQIGVSTHHRGHYEFRICDRPLDPEHFNTPAEGQDCLDTWLLERAPLKADCAGNFADPDCQVIDPDQPHRWFLPPPGAGTQVAGADWSDQDAPDRPSVTEIHKMRYKIPMGLSCQRCTLQWYWSTGNTCLFDAGYFSYFNKMVAAGWSNPTSWCNFCTEGNTCTGTCCGDDKDGVFGEEFWNCADIAVIGDAVPEDPTPSPPTLTPAPTPEQPAPTPPVGPVTCDGLCGRTSQSRCSTHDNDQGACESGYMVADSLFIPCSWTDCGCIADGDNLLECPNLDENCAAMPGPTPAPTLAPTSDPATRCDEFCQHENLSQRFLNWTRSASDPTYCFYYKGHSDLCQASYIRQSGLTIPCMWSGSDCVADHTGAVNCADFTCPLAA